jgi:hypothetical protein
MEIKMKCMQITIFVFVLPLAACGDPIEAAHVNTDGSSSAVDVDTDGETDGSTDDSQPTINEEKSTTPSYVCKDEDGDGFCTKNASGATVDCNDTIDDANGDGLVDGKQFVPNLADICDGLDNDCDGATDENTVVTSMYIDGDGDGFGVGEQVSTCNPAGYAEKAGDCDDEDVDIHPGADDESGDGIDSDCDDETVSVGTVGVVLLTNAVVHSHLLI